MTCAAITIIFKLSDVLVSISGNECSGTTSKDERTIFTKGYRTNKYPHNANCSWTIQALPDRKIRLNPFGYKLYTSNNTTTKVDTSTLETCSDYLDIYDGSNRQSSKIEKLCGRGTSNEIVSSSNTMFLNFVSDAFDNEEGFEIEYRVNYSKLSI